MNETKEVKIQTTCPKCHREYMCWSHITGENGFGAYWKGVCDDFICGEVIIVDEAEFEYDNPQLLSQAGIALASNNIIPAAEMATLHEMGEHELADQLYRFVAQNVEVKH